MGSVQYSIAARYRYDTRARVLLCGAPARGCKPKIFSKLESDIIIIILNYFYLISFFLLVLLVQLLQKQRY